MEISLRKDADAARLRGKISLVMAVVIAMFAIGAAVVVQPQVAAGGDACDTVKIEVPGPPYGVTATVDIPIGWSLTYDLLHEKIVSPTDDTGNWAGQTNVWEMDANGFPVQRFGDIAWPVGFFWEGIGQQLRQDHFTFVNTTDSSSVLFEVGIENNGVFIDPTEGAMSTIVNPRLIDLGGNESPACFTLVNIGEPWVDACPDVRLSTQIKPAPTINRTAKVSVPPGWDLLFDVIHQRDDWNDPTELPTGDWIATPELLEDTAGQAVIDTTPTKPANFRFHRSTYVSADVRLTNFSASEDVLVHLKQTFAAGAVDPEDNARSWIANVRTVDLTGVETPVCITWPECAGQAPTIVIMDANLATWGTAADDVILGTNWPDVIAGAAGDDIICGLAGDDAIWGNDGADEIHGDDGNDKLRGNGDNDKMMGGAGDDDMVGGRGDDMMDGGSGNDDMRGRTGNDMLDGGAGNEVRMAGNGGEDMIRGGDGDDVMTGGPRPDELYGGDGDDKMKGNGGGDVLAGEAGDDDLRGGPQPDALDGGDGTDICNGGSTFLAAESDTAVWCETVTLVP